MRKGEILSIQRNNINFDHEHPSIYVPKAKAGARNHSITKDLAEYLAQYVKALPKGTS
jgi:integrase